jgi:hypothetical protein
MIIYTYTHNIGWYVCSITIIKRNKPLTIIKMDIKIHKCDFYIKSLDYNKIVGQL